jgi:methylmalonyl-CoA mutase N-terminal domain/subunit
VLDRLQAAARNERENLLPLIVEAVEAYCTLGEISDTFRAEWGEARDFGHI